MRNFSILFYSILFNRTIYLPIMGPFKKKQKFKIKSAGGWKRYIAARGFFFLLLFLTDEHIPPGPETKWRIEHFILFFFRERERERRDNDFTVCFFTFGCTFLLCLCGFFCFLASTVATGPKRPRRPLSFQDCYYQRKFSVVALFFIIHEGVK